MNDLTKLKDLSGRLTQLRAELLQRFPFFGRLLLHLQFGYADCKTAYTDMRKIVFDPVFAGRICDEELQFVMLHELYHCVLRHCTRGRTLSHHLYNIACDIVVNSMVMELLGTDTFAIDNEEVIHLAPDGSEGRVHNAEQVYDMLLHASDEDIEKWYGGSGFDTHIMWGQIAASMDDIWARHIREAGLAAGNGSGIPQGLKRYLSDVEHEPKIDWRQLLHDFIQHDRSDYVFSVPDRRYQDDIILPSFQENVYGDHVENIWFCVDTSGSISDDMLTQAMQEIE